MKRISSDYINLKKSINTYIKKVKIPNKENNESILKELHFLLKSKNVEDNKKYIKLRNELALSNGGFAMKYSMRYYGMLNDDASISDLFQEAMMGITEAIDTFDIKKEVSFTTYAFFHVRKRLIDYIKKIKIVRAPRDIARNIKHVSDAADNFLTKNEREATSSELANYLKINKGIVIEINMIENIMQLISLNSIGSEKSYIVEYQEQITNNDNNIKSNEYDAGKIISFTTNDSKTNLIQRFENHLTSIIKKLQPEEQKIINMRFGIDKDIPHCMEEINVILGKDVSRED